jgi:hypothetical protein
MVQSLSERPVEGAAQAALPGDHRESDLHGDRLAWDGFRELYYPDSRRHDLAAIVAYGSYKRSSYAAPLPVPAAMAAEVPPLDEWEDEGGASR